MKFTNSGVQNSSYQLIHSGEYFMPFYVEMWKFQKIIFCSERSLIIHVFLVIALIEDAVLQQ